LLLDLREELLFSAELTVNSPVFGNEKLVKFTAVSIPNKVAILHRRKFLENAFGADGHPTLSTTQVLKHITVSSDEP